MEQDPTERGLRKALNLGHTVGHAIESLMLRRATPVLHGYAVAWGLVCELFMASTKLDFPTEHLYAVTRYVTTHYGRPEITCDDYDELRELMLHDKKIRPAWSISRNWPRSAKSYSIKLPMPP